VGTIARIGELQRGLGGVQLILHGEQRGVAVRIAEEDGYLQAVIREADDMVPLNPEDSAFRALYREVRERAAELGKRAGLSEEVVGRVLQAVTEPGRLADLVAAYTEMPTADRQGLLETLPVEERLRRVLVQVQRQIGVLDAQETIKSQVQEELGDRQREIYLREQLKAIQRELGEGDESEDLEELRAKLDALDLPAAARKEVDREFGRLVRIGRESMESQVIRNFLETISELPWDERSEEHLDIQQAERILEEDHYGLEDVKDRVLEFLAVRQLRQAELDEQAAERPRRRSQGGRGARDGADRRTPTSEAPEGNGRGRAGAGETGDRGPEVPEGASAPSAGDPLASRTSTRPRTAPRRPRPTAGSADAEDAAGPRRTTALPRARSCSSSARRASARPRSPSRSPARWAASTSASRSAAPATRPTSAATGAPTSARCRAASSRA
jgi:ATP-dependent Lon protease